MAEPDMKPPEDPFAPAPPTLGLSGKLLLLTIVFVMISEVLIYTPSIARFRKDYMDNHIARAHLAALALNATPDMMVSHELENELLFHANAHAIVLEANGMRMLALRKSFMPAVDMTVDLRQGSFFTWIGDAFMALQSNENRVIRAIGTSPKDPAVTVEVTFDEKPLRDAMLAFSARILQLSVVISLITAGAVFLSLQWLTVRPMSRITRAMIDFRQDPEDDTRIIDPSGRGDEVGMAERELARMQSELQTALHQKGRLATLGAAVAKINHDLRNSLATAVLISDRLASVNDPEVRKVTPKLYDSIDFAVKLCTQTMDYVRDQKPKIEKSRFPLHVLVREVGGDRITVGNEVDPQLQVEADREQLFRILSNLTHNAEQAGATELKVGAKLVDGKVVIHAADNGPGMPQRAQQNLFKPFVGSSRKGGTGLGLVIVRDLMRAHCGDAFLEETGEGGTTFRLELPGLGHTSVRE